MADNTERIEQEIAQAREDLAATLDQLADRANPQRIADDAKQRAVETINKPAVKYGLAGLGVFAGWLLVRKLRRR
ncbi:DUF3618 domain-containing protein [Gordonia sp. X0973]|uniref:DUF3618 domain-containing protein n=1 Tax=Gordonia sp. X0973 TaxID=2742602 RepID=UPI000F52068C|nr:DUF3618 domain-containing protein [Gordonia sp. X0973]QKT06888.1 DUF3618 domain-containing protein [Gordonia sp. X0973]